MSGGAMAMGVADHIVMYENSIFSVISPEGCSGILWKDKSHTEAAAQAMAIDAPALYTRGFVDELIHEPEPGAHAHQANAIEAMQTSLNAALSSLTAIDQDTLIARRHERLKRLSSSFLCQS